MNLTAKELTILSLSKQHDYHIALAAITDTGLALHSTNALNTILIVKPVFSVGLYVLGVQSSEQCSTVLQFCGKSFKSHKKPCYVN